MCNTNTTTCGSNLKSTCGSNSTNLMDKCCGTSAAVTVSWPTYYDSAKVYYPDNIGKFNVPGSFVYLDENKDLKEVYIKQVIYQNPATIVFWSDDTKTVSKIHANDTYSPEAGLVLCILKKTQGRTLKGLLEAWVPYDSFSHTKQNKVIQTLKDVRKFLKFKTK